MPSYRRDYEIFNNEDFYTEYRFTGDYTTYTIAGKLKDPLLNSLATGGDFSFVASYNGTTGKTSIVASIDNSIINALPTQKYKYDIILSSAIQQVYFYGDFTIRQGITTV